MEMEDRRYRADFIDFVRDSYRVSTSGRSLFHYLGVSASLLYEQYQAWEKNPTFN